MIGDAQIISGEMHYPRIPRAAWRDRLRMARAMGLNAISTYVFWNLHEPLPGVYDFTGAADVAAFIREAQAQGLAVILRPGPYVCAEWDFGGLPAWLLAGDPVAIRTTDERYMEPVRRWLRRLGEEVAPLQRAYGGPIVAVQLENEYGAFGCDRAYLEAMRTALDDAGFGRSPYFTIDQPDDLARGALPDLPVGVTCAPGKLRDAIAASRAFRPEQRPFCAEYWAGWFDHWGEPHETRDDDMQADDLAWLLREGHSVNIYMFHGGTNFGYWNGANTNDDLPYQPTTTSYDYLAALDEAGRPTPKYNLFRRTIERVTSVAPPPIPPAPRTIAVAPFLLSEAASLDAILVRPVRSPVPRTMESIGAAYGYALYRTKLGPGDGLLQVEGLHDYAVISVDGRVVGSLDRRRNESVMALAVGAGGARLDILIENSGRINYGPHLSSDRKGITGEVRWGRMALRDWEIFALSGDDRSSLRYEQRRIDGPAFYRGWFEMETPADTFLDVRELGKGTLWVNGQHAGRFWRIGPQHSLYIPGSWMHAGRNEVVAFDLEGSFEACIRGSEEPILE